MCGIVGYVGQKSAAEVVHKGLKKLEYRGYDSAGMVVSYQAKNFLIKSPGKLDMLEKKLGDLPKEAGVGMGHTRWATHGPPTLANSHPHTATGVSIIHNGIIENYLELREKLIETGAKFQSETDTEVLAHLLADHYAKLGNPEKTIQAALKQIQGAYALGIMFHCCLDAIFVAKQGSPLVIGLGSKENFFASDAIPFAGEVERVIFLQDGQWGKITAGSVDLHNFSGKKVDSRGEPLNWNFGSIEKNGFRHFMRKEIHEQPDVIAKTIEKLACQSKKILNLKNLGLEDIDLASIEKIHIVACGTAYLAGLLGKYFLEPATHIPVNVELASEFRYRDPHFGEPKSNLVIAVSQSGETADTLASVKHAASLGCQVYSICNVQHSSIPRASTSTLYMEAGPEVGVASTKAFTSQVLCLYMVTLALAEFRKKLDKQELQQILTELQKLPIYLSTALSEEVKIKELARRFYESPNFLFVGRGTRYPIALEGALKLKEISYIHAEGFAAGELKHGPIALIDHHMPILAIAPKDTYYPKTLSNIQEIRAREGVVIVVGDRGDAQLKECSEELIHCPNIANPALQSIISTIPVQLLAYHIAVKRGTDVDQPRNLAKSVTVE